METKIEVERDTGHESCLLPAYGAFKVVKSV